MATVLDITIAVGPTAILAEVASQRPNPPTLLNAGANDITLTFGSDPDTLVLVPGDRLRVRTRQAVSGTVAAATEILKVLDRIEFV